MGVIRQSFAYGMIFSAAISIGYDSGYLNGVLGSEDFIRLYGISDDGGLNMYLSPTTRSIFSSILIVGTLIGCLANTFITSRIGRRGSLRVAAVLYTIGVSMQVSGSVQAVFIVGRILLGMAIGLISNTVPSYLMECSTAANRGRLMAFYLQFLTTGNVLACAINYGTTKYSDSRSWRITIGFQLFLAVIIGVGAFVCPESPLVLSQRGQIDAARASYAILKNRPQDSHEVNDSMQKLEQHLQESAALGVVNVAECFQGSDLRRTMIGLAMSFFTIATGITFWFGYGTTFFQAAGVENSYLISLILALVNCVFTAPSIYLIERFGRRRSLMYGGAIMALTQILTGIIYTLASKSVASQNMLVAGAVVFIAAYAPTWGIGGWLLMAEPFSNRLRTYQSAIVLAFYWIITWLVGFITPYLVDATAANLGVYVSYIWLGTGVLSLVWTHLCVPELAGLSVKEIDQLFERKVPAWRSRAWQKKLRVINSIDSPSIDDASGLKGITVGNEKKV
ncbi:hypothetical protein PFICI_04308 [Pestalotiopsis fici W106-1]|uniref:Major facilitator superfamily (MFS) profile domain-containing protein n=1 Tax=Pestalotiopsis fici (strain W106-1 / CGMCC3.15140) TaxID=1229662 RepID=W3XAJ1_PESFW|nr:uncharacterized protein PFICI_04308 [Pestalotiopsis fici W106-1]ETS82432.1 hypothetical protein PFICI_04308 [Pestalotiopsis fici W106-1]